MNRTNNYKGKPSDARQMAKKPPKKRPQRQRKSRARNSTDPQIYILSVYHGINLLKKTTELFYLPIVRHKPYDSQSIAYTTGLLKGDLPTEPIQECKQFFESLERTIDAYSEIDSDGLRKALIEGRQEDQPLEYGALNIEQIHIRDYLEHQRSKLYDEHSPVYKLAEALTTIAQPLDVLCSLVSSGNACCPNHNTTVTRNFLEFLIAGTFPLIEETRLKALETGSDALEHFATSAQEIVNALDYRKESIIYQIPDFDIMTHDHGQENENGHQPE